MNTVLTKPETTENKLTEEELFTIYVKLKDYPEILEKIWLKKNRLDIPKKYM